MPTAYMAVQAPRLDDPRGTAVLHPAQYARLIYFGHSAAKIYREFTRILRISWNTSLNRPFEGAISLIDFTSGPLWSSL